MTEWLSDTLIATSALLALVLLIREPVRRHFGARTAYALWLLPAARALMPTISTTVERTVPAATLPTPSPFVPTIAAEPQLMGSVTPVSNSIVDALGGWPTIALAVWAGVSAGLILRGIGDYRSQRASILRGSVQLAWIGSIRLVRSEGVRGPTAFGLIDRVIAVPDDFERRYDAPERRLALAHELAHHRHGDLFANTFAFVLLSLQWFNPLAWWSYAAFRFDQEAACDARVLDKARPSDRADYGRAIAKAASGRALLLASALDNRKTLHRRLKSMLNTTTKGRRIAGVAVIAVATAIILPLTATRAINFVDVAAPQMQKAVAASAPAAAPIAAVAAVSAQDAVAPAAPVQAASSVGEPNIDFYTNDTVRINGRTTSWSELTPADRNQIRRETAKARAELTRSRAGMETELQQARAEMEKFRNGEFEREMANARAEIARSLREIDEHAADFRLAGVDPEKVKAEMRASLTEVEKIDVEKIKREALASVDADKMKADMYEAEKSLIDIERKLDALDRK